MRLLIENVELLGRCVLLEELGGDLALSSEDDTILGEDTDGGTGMGNSFQSIFDLVQTTFGGEDSCLLEEMVLVGVANPKLRQAAITTTPTPPSSIWRYQVT